MALLFKIIKVTEISLCLKLFLGCPRAQKMEQPFLKGVTRVHYTLKKYLILKGKSND